MTQMKVAAMLMMSSLPDSVLLSCLMDLCCVVFGVSDEVAGASGKNG